MQRDWFAAAIWFVLLIVVGVIFIGLLFGIGRTYYY
jgi:hypothetical protein